MSVSDPLLKELKGCILKLLKLNEDIIQDNHDSVLEICSTIEAILRKGLTYFHSSAFGIVRKDYWTWIDYFLQSTSYLDASFKLSLRKLLDTARVKTSQGKGRLFIRHALSFGCLHIPVEQMVRKNFFDRIYGEESIIGNEILGEIFLSLVLQISQIKFDLQLKNASFLDETWHLPQFHSCELPPCLDLGIHLGHVKGWAVVLKVDRGSAAEENKIEIGDVIDEIFGVCIRGWRKGRIAALFKQRKGLPIPLKIIKLRFPGGEIYSGLVPILRRLQIDLNCITERVSDATSPESTRRELYPATSCKISGHYVEFLGSVDVGGFGDISLIDMAISDVLRKQEPPTPVAMLTKEIGVQTLLRPSGKVFLTHSYTEISSCGRLPSNPFVYGYIAGNTSCNLSSYFTCYVFQASSEELSKEILLTLADGFHRTHWAV